jgi:ankyrin repeat protein
VTPDDFLRLACLDYERWHRSDAEKARAMLAAEPELARADIYAASAAGDVDAAREMLDRDPSLVNAKGGPFGWEPLLYACYSRVGSTLEVAQLLLARGADPNAGYLWHGNVPPFTALTAAFGEGEDTINQPPHPDRDALAKLLLDAGADPNDGQTLYNRHFNPNDDHLKLLFDYGLGVDKGGPWLRLDRMMTPAAMLAEELWCAARRNLPERVKLLVEHGADVNMPGFRDGRTPYDVALFFGREDIAAYLLEHGAKKGEPTPDERFAAACIAGRRDEVMAILAEEPKRLERLGMRGRVELVQRAVEANSPAGIRLMAELRFELSGVMPHDGVGVNLKATPMHNATGRLEMVKLLIELGADPQVRDLSYHATPLGWARHMDQRDTADYLMQFATIFDAVQNGGVERAAALLRDDPSLANAVDQDGRSLIDYIRNQMPRRDEMIALLRSVGAGFSRHTTG